jgi:hypothetical protein
MGICRVQLLLEVLSPITNRPTVKLKHCIAKTDNSWESTRGNYQAKRRCNHCGKHDVPSVSGDVYMHIDLLSSKGWVDAMFRVGRNQEVRADEHTRAGAFFERDDGQTVKEVIENLFTLLCGLLRDAIPNLGRG